MRRTRAQIAADRKTLAESKRGKVLYFGRYRTRDEIVLYLLTHGWEGATVARDSTGWILTLGDAVCVLFPCAD